MLKFLILICASVLLSGCMAVLVGGAAAGGYYVGNNYEITKKSDSNSN